MLDWLKAIGITLIVYGHVAHATTIPLTPPIYLKQLGVAFFLFATAYTLARERRAALEVLFNRLFRIYFYGVPFAILMTVVTAWSGRGLALSNYLPFAGGLNVVFDNFPANPTTWYIGTYLHLLVLWAVWLRHCRVQPWMVILAVAVEIPIRAALIGMAGPYVAYMLATNWASVFLYGLLLGQVGQVGRVGRVAPSRQPALPAPPALPALSALPFAIVLFVGLTTWAWAMRVVGFEPAFPTMTIVSWPAWLALVLISASVSTLYLSTTALVFEVVRRIPTPAAIRFLSRGSLVIFLVHMPLFYALHPLLVEWGFGYWTRVIVQLFINVVALGWLSDLLTLLAKPDAVRARLRVTFFASAKPLVAVWQTFVYRVSIFSRRTAAPR
jgi:hypothetical protein